MSYPRDPSYGVFPETDNDPRRQMMNQRYRLSTDEMRVLKECNKESFFQRCVPLMAALGGSTYLAIKAGYLKPAGGQLGAFPKVSAALVLAFVFGKLSYQSKCEEKILALPGGQLKEAILTRRQMRSGDMSARIKSSFMDPTFAPSVMPFAGGESYSDDSKSIAELDTDRPLEPLFDAYRSSTENREMDLNIPQIAPSQSTTYDDLRRKNRAEYDERQTRYRPGLGSLDDVTPYRGPTSPPISQPRIGVPNDDNYYGGQSLPPPPPPPQSPSYARESRGAGSYSHQKNQYGDVWER